MTLADALSVPRYATVDHIPPELIARYSSAKFQSMWLCWHMALPDQITIVDLTPEMKRGAL